VSELLESWPAIYLTLKLACITVLVLLTLGLPFAWWLAHYKGKLKPIFEALVALPLVLPPTVLGFYLLTAFSPQSSLGSLWIKVTGEQFVFSFAGILFGSIVYSLPFVVQPLLSAFSQLGTHTTATISTLGIKPLPGFLFVIIPSVRASIISAATLGFAHTLGEFGLILMIGGNIPGETQVVSIALFNQVESLQYEQAHALSMFLLLISMVSLTLLYKFNRQARLISTA
jgi:molybdate transport system permease protein